MMRNVVFIMVLFLLVSTCLSDVFFVPLKFASIQAAIDVANQGDIVMVSPGIYFENIDFKGKPITVTSTNINDPSSTVIDGGGKGSVVRFLKQETMGSIIQGFTITNGNMRGPGVGGGKGGGGGIYCDTNASPIIRNNIICENTAEFNGGGIYCHNASPIISNNVISYNTTTSKQGSGGAGIFCVFKGCRGSIINNTIVENETVKVGGGICLASGAIPIIKNNIIAFNLASYTGGVFCDIEMPTFTFNNIFGNEKENFLELPSPVGRNGNISVDPMFSSLGDSDFHLQTTGNRWNGTEWVSDEIDSPCIDAGDPTMPVGGECGNHMWIINMGAYGGTPQASCRKPDTTPKD